MGRLGVLRLGSGQEHTEEVKAALTILDCPHQHLMPTSQLITICHPIIMDVKVFFFFFLKNDDV